MTKTITLLPGITLRCVTDHRFKQGALSLQIIRPMDKDEAALNALLPAVLLRGSQAHPNIRAITNRLDELYGASIGSTVRRVGDYQTTGMYCSFIEDRYAFAGGHVLASMVDFLRELLLEPALEEGVFRGDFVEGEKKNLIAVIEAERNDKRAYANNQMMRLMCRADSFGIPRLGDKASIAAISPESLYEHYRRILRESRVDLFYVGAGDPEQVARAAKTIFEGIDRNYVNLPAQTAFCDGGAGEETEEMEVAQGKLAMGFVTPITIRDAGFVAMQLFNLIFGAGMTSKLFMQVREKLSLCYDIGSGYHGAKGIVMVSAGIDSDKDALVRDQVMEQLAACQEGRITEAELESARKAMLSSLKAVHDAPGSIEGFYATSALSGLSMTLAEYKAAVEAVTAEQVAAAARTVKLHTVYFLKGVQ